MRYMLPLTLVAVALLGAASFGTSAKPIKTEPGADGGVCHVTGGPNRGKTGKYDKGFCCDESQNGWGCTECTGSNAGKCADGPAKKSAIGPDKAIQPGGGTLQKAE